LLRLVKLRFNAPLASRSRHGALDKTLKIKKMFNCGEMSENLLGVLANHKQTFKDNPHF